MEILLSFPILFFNFKYFPDIFITYYVILCGVYTETNKSVYCKIYNIITKIPELYFEMKPNNVEFLSFIKKNIQV